MINKIKKLLLVSRPVSWINTAFPFGCAYLLAAGGVDWLFGLGSLFFLLPYNLIMYGVNDVYDYESDLANPRKGGIEGAVESRSFHSTILKACLIFSLPFLIGLIWLQPTVLNVASLAAVLFMAVAYSLKGLRFKEIPVLDSLTSSFHFVSPAVYGLLLADPNKLSQWWPYLLAFYLWGMASHAFGAVQDIIPDRQAKISSIATYFGARNTVIFSFLLYLAACLLVVLQNKAAFAVGFAGLAYVINLWPYRDITDKTSQKINPAWRRFIYLNYFVGFDLTISLIINYK